MNKQRGLKTGFGERLDSVAEKLSITTNVLSQD